MSGDGFISSVTAGSADVFRFDTAYGLTQKQVNNVNVVFLLQHDDGALGSVVLPY